MAFLSLQFPAGVYRNGTEYQAKGRWRDANLVRFFEGAIRPVGGWRAKTTNTLIGKGRAIVTWTDNSSVAWTAVGTEQKLYVITRSGYLYDITPAGFTRGFSDASAAPGFGGATYGSAPYGRYPAGAVPLARGFGGGNFGAGVYGSPPPDTASIQDATVWSLDYWGEYLVGCSPDDGKIYQWQLNTSAPAAVIANAPAARAILATEQRILMALGAGGNPRCVAWSDQENNAVWTPAATNQAGSFNLQTSGRLICGKRFRGAVLLLTDLDAWLASYTGDVYVYSFQRLGAGCGGISANCAAALDSAVVWMGKSGFWWFNGFVEKVPCEVSDYVFGRLNNGQASKIACWHNSAFSEVTWFYPAGNENDSYVTWNYREKHWTIGALSRLSAADRGALSYPLLVGPDGFIYEHENGYSWDAATPYLESGPVEFGAGDNVIYATQLVPDEKTQGQVTATFKTRFYPNGPESVYGPYQMSAPTDVRFSGRSIRLRYDGVARADWRVGVPRLDVIVGGKR